MKKISTLQCLEKISQKVKLAGWVAKRRDHGKIIFLDLRDREGNIQLVFTPSNKPVYQKAQELRAEWVIEVEGKVTRRPQGMENPQIATGKIEIEVESLNILSQAKALPFEIEDSGKGIKEDLRMRYRYLDLRTPRMKENLFKRHQTILFIRNYLHSKGFWEIETPILTKSTPEGARDYLVPSRQQPGKFYALPQSPQQYKQLLMVGGIEKYFQIARCFRDEDPRGDRQPEFTQLDLEMSFVTQEEILSLVEDLFIQLIKAVFPEKKITQIPFPRLDYDEVMKKYRTDKPDLRTNKKDRDELAFAFIVNWPLFEFNKEENRFDPYHHIFTAPRSEDIALLGKNPQKVRSYQHDLVLNGVEIGGGSIRITDPQIQKKILQLVGLKEKEIEEKFAHLLRAFEFGVPPHGGIAPGLDRVLMILLGEASIREVIAFPKTGDGRDLMMDAPSPVEEKQLDELSLKLKK